MMTHTDDPDQLQRDSEALEERGELAAALQTQERACALLRAQGDPARLMKALTRQWELTFQADPSADLLPLAQEATALCRGLATSDPDQYLGELADSLHNLSLALADHDQDDAAVEAAEEAVHCYRERARRDPEATPDLANALQNLGIQYNAREDYALGAEITREALALFRALCEQAPDAFEAEVAGCLHNLSLSLAALDRGKPALEAIQEATDRYRALAARDPDTYHPELAHSLNFLSLRRAELQQADAALEALKEATELYRALARQRPEDFNDALAMGLYNLCLDLHERNQTAQAQRAVEEAITLQRPLASADPEEHAPALADSLHELALLLMEKNRPALAPLREALQLLLALPAPLDEGLRDTLEEILSDYQDALDDEDLDPEHDAVANAALEALNL